MSLVSGSFPAYTMVVYSERLQPVLLDADDRLDNRIWCPAEERYIGDVMDFISIHCPSANARHTFSPDPLTRRRMRAAYRRLMAKAN